MLTPMALARASLASTRTYPGPARAMWNADVPMSGARSTHDIGTSSMSRRASSGWIPISALAANPGSVIVERRERRRRGRASGCWTRRARGRPRNGAQQEVERAVGEDLRERVVDEDGTVREAAADRTVASLGDRVEQVAELRHDEHEVAVEREHVAARRGRVPGAQRTADTRVRRPPNEPNPWVVRGERAGRSRRSRPCSSRRRPRSRGCSRRRRRGAPRDERCQRSSPRCGRG